MQNSLAKRFLQDKPAAIGPEVPKVGRAVTVRLDNASHAPIVLTYLSEAVPVPDFSYSLAPEDAEGIISGQGIDE